MEFPNFFEGFMKKDTRRSNEVEDLKKSLLEVCRSPETKRVEVEEIISKLEPLSPTPSSASSPLLQKEWLLEWTTEKEINFFVDWGLSGDITQTIDGNVLNNKIEFKRGGYLGVSGSAIPSQDRRTDFQFQSATLDLAKWGSYKVPPVGQGWFDTVYLDDDIRVDCNSRKDILICTPKVKED